MAWHDGYLTNKNIVQKQIKNLCILKLSLVCIFQKENECAAFNSSYLMFRSKNEVCAGNKIPYPKMKVYQRKLEVSKPGDSNRTFTFKLVKETKDSVR